MNNCIMSDKIGITRFHIYSLRSTDKNVHYSLLQSVCMTCLFCKLWIVNGKIDL